LSQDELGWVNDLSTAVLPWLESRELTLSQFGDLIGCAEHDLYNALKRSPRRVLPSEKVYVYASIYVETGLPEADPRTIPEAHIAQSGFLGKGQKIQKRAWSQRRFEAWERLYSAKALVAQTQGVERAQLVAENEQILLELYNELSEIVGSRSISINIGGE
jgi:hypothetical protein